jgi:hypothetical protein
MAAAISTVAIRAAMKRNFIGVSSSLKELPDIRQQSVHCPRRRYAKIVDPRLSLMNIFRQNASTL